jgi:hypothetical protein
MSFPQHQNQEREITMKSITVTFVAIAGLGFCVAPMALAADDSFVGKWKFNPEKSQLSGLTYKVEEAGGSQYKFAFGDDSETITLGKPHLTKYGNTWTITKSGPNAWKWVIKRNGKVISDATWTVSDDGATSTYVETATRQDGSTSHNETKLKRTAGTSGLVGTWESTEIKIGSPTTTEIAKWGMDGYSMKNPADKTVADFKLDGKEYMPKGPAVATGTTVSGKKVDENKMELTYKLKGKVTDTDSWELSADGKTLTDTITFPGVDKQEVDVFDRQ